ncbi:hypothetical protein ACH4MW_21270 [Streptomyces luteogriseus]|uniref:hypothetical protein n=1 Tax=Streptomyces luteogriseus TaxID=68233 RepID=UPI0037934CBC
MDRRCVHSEGGPVETIDAEDGRKPHELDAKGRATGARAASWTESYAYDSGGRLVSSRQEQGDSSEGTVWVE